MWALIGGVVAVVLGIVGLVNWWSLFVKGLMAAVPILLVLGGIVAVSSGVSDMKDRIAEKKEKAKEEVALKGVSQSEAKATLFRKWIATISPKLNIDTYAQRYGEDTAKIITKKLKVTESDLYNWAKENYPDLLRKAYPGRSYMESMGR